MQNIHMRTWIAVAAAIIVIAYVFWQGIWSPLVNKFAAGTPAAVGASNTNNMNLSLPGDDTNTGEVSQTGTGSHQEALPNLPDNQIGVIDVKVGTGAEAKAGDTVSVQYTGFLTDGKQFDSSKDRGPFTFILGSGQVIPGFDRGITGMKVGSVRRIIIPPKLGYGDKAAGTIPPNSTLLFEVELVKVGK